MLWTFVSVLFQCLNWCQNWGTLIDATVTVSMSLSLSWQFWCWQYVSGDRTTCWRWGEYRRSVVSWPRLPPSGLHCSSHTSQHQQPSLLLLLAVTKHNIYHGTHSWATHLSWVEILTLMSFCYEIIIGLRIPKMSSFIKYERHSILLCTRIRIQPPHQWQVWH